MASPSDSRKESGKGKESRLYRLLNNRFFLAVIVCIVVLLFFFMIQRISWIFKPVAEMIRTLFLPVLLTGILYYLSVPLVNFLERKGISRTVGAWIVIGILILIVLALVASIPTLLEELKRLIIDLSGLLDEYEEKLSQVVTTRRSRDFVNFLQNVFSQANIDWKETVSKAVSEVSTSISSAVNVTVRVVVALVTAPFILFYLLKDGSKFSHQASKIIPPRYRETTMKMFSQINSQLSSYVRGEILVCVAVAIMFIIGFAFIDLPYGVVFGILAGILNVIPYLGSFIAMLFPLVVAFLDSPFMVLKVLIVFCIEQAIESRIISPLILGTNLNIHPITIMFLLLIGGDLWGVPGIILIIPVYAACKVVVTNFFEWFKNVSGLYAEDEEEKEKLEASDSSNQESNDNQT